jgi:hypothetical protein
MLFDVKATQAPLTVSALRSRTSPSLTTSTSTTPFMSVSTDIYLMITTLADVTAHTAGRYAKKQFAKGRMPIVERLVNA